MPASLTFPYARFADLRIVVRQDRAVLNDRSGSITNRNPPAARLDSPSFFSTGAVLGYSRYAYLF
jgi:hypothetical protein